MREVYANIQAKNYQLAAREERKNTWYFVGFMVCFVIGYVLLGV